jgi:hypothetical protein
MDFPEREKCTPVPGAVTKGLQKVFSLLTLCENSKREYRTVKPHMHDDLHGGTVLSSPTAAFPFSES